MTTTADYVNQKSAVFYSRFYQSKKEKITNIESFLITEQYISCLIKIRYIFLASVPVPDSQLDSFFFS